MKLSLAIVAGLALASACGGKSSRDEKNAESGGASQVVSGGSGGHTATSGGATGAANSAGAGAGAPAIGGAGPGAPATGGAGGACLLPDGNVPLDARKCLNDSDCATLTLNECCSEDRVVGVTKYPNCTVAPTHCDASDCDKPPGFVTDDGVKTVSRDQLRVSCQFSETGAGRCRTLVANFNDVVCGALICNPGDVCVHLSPRGGPAPRCFPLPNDGLCPPESEYAADCDGAPGCRELLLTPEPYCASIPPSCRAPLRCACISPDFCRAPQVCANVLRSDVYCQDPSP